MPRLTASTLGTALSVDMTETLLAGALLDGQTAEVASLTAELQTLLRRGNRSLQKDGKPVADPVEATNIATAIVRHALDKRVPVLRRLGMLGG